MYRSQGVDQEQFGVEKMSGKHYRGKRAANITGDMLAYKIETGPVAEHECSQWNLTQYGTYGSRGHSVILSKPVAHPNQNIRVWLMRE